MLEPSDASSIGKAKLSKTQELDADAGRTGLAIGRDLKIVPSQ
jgi:hypothetical protein